MEQRFEDILEQEGQLVYTNVGTSMMPLLRQRRDVMLIRKKGPERLHWLDCPLYKRDNGQYILHRVLWVRRHDYIICGDNQWHPETGITDRHVIGVLEAVDRDGKQLLMSSAKMRLYGFLQFVFFPLRALVLFMRAVPGAIKRRVQR